MTASTALSQFTSYLFWICDSELYTCGSMLWFVVLGSVLLSTAEAQKIPLPFSYITSKTGSFVTAGAIPMVDLALELINNRTDILANYTLTYNNTIGDSNVRKTGT